MKADWALIAPLIEAELQRILASPQFATSERLQRFLCYVVNATIEGNTDHLKESVIGVQVFDLKIGFDPKLDPVVRVTARRLRDKLEQFYAEYPGESGIVLQLPKGGYVPEIVPGPVRETAAAAQPAPEVPAVVEAVPIPPAPATLAKGRSWRLAVAMGCSVILAALAFWIVRSQGAAFEGPVSRFTIDLPASQRILPWYGNNLAFSPNGQTLAYIGYEDGERRLYLRQSASSATRRVADSEGAAAPFFAPDGQSLVYYTPRELRRYYLDGHSTVIAALPERLTLFGGIWYSSQDLLFDNAPADVQREGQSFLYRLSLHSGAQPVRFTHRQSAPNESHMVQQQLPDGRGYLVSLNAKGHTIQSLSSDGTRWKLLMDDAKGGLYVPTGHLIFWRAGSLMAAPMDLAKLEITGPAVVAIPDVADSGWEGPDIAISAQGTLAYVHRSSVMPDRRLVWVDLSGHETAVPVPPGPLDPLDISADGQKLLLTRFDPGKHVWTLWSYSLVTFEARQLTGTNPNRIVGNWSPDGKQVVFNRIAPGETRTNLFRINADGTGNPEQLTHVDEGGNTPQSWSRDGKWLVYEDGMRPDTKSDIWARAMVGDPKPHPVVSTPDYDRNPALSPDGRWLAYVHETAGNAEVFLQPFPDGGTPVKVGQGTGPLWAPNETRLYVRRGSKMFALELQLGTGTKVVEERFLFEGKYVTPDLWLREQLISPDGKHFLLTKEEVDPNESRRIQVVVNWFAELNRLFRPAR